MKTTEQMVERANRMIANEEFSAQGDLETMRDLLNELAERVARDLKCLDENGRPNFGFATNLVERLKEAQVRREKKLQTAEMAKRLVEFAIDA
jgi:hypothetical protein